MSRVTLKFLVSNPLAGSLIGTGGAAIKELMEVTSARVTVSSITDVYPGTSDRIVLISGPHDCVDMAQGLIWELIASFTASNGDKSVPWSPKAAHEAEGANNEVQVCGKVSIPAAAGGLILGKGGAFLRSMAEESGANINMTSKDDAMFTQERVLTITGMAGSCDKFVSLLLSRFADEPEGVNYVNRGLTYSSHHLNPFPTNNRNNNRRNNRDGSNNNNNNNRAGEDIDEVGTTEINITVPDSMVGNILGRAVSQTAQQRLCFYVAILLSVIRCCC